MAAAACTPLRNTRQHATPAATRTRLLNAALLCYHRRGIAAATIADIAAAAGVTRPTVYRYFESHSALLTAVVRRELVQFWADVRAGIGGGTAPVDYLVEAVVRSLRAARAQENPALLFLPGVLPIVRELLMRDRTLLHTFARRLRADYACSGGAGALQRGDWLMLSELFSRVLAVYLEQPSLVCRSEGELGRRLASLLEALTKTIAER